MTDCNKCITENCIFNTLVPKENCELYREEDTTTDCTDCKARIRADAIEECIKKLAESEDTILSDSQYYTLIKGAE